MLLSDYLIVFRLFAWLQNHFSAFQDKEQGKNIVVVGSWNEEEHIDWAKRNVARSYQLRDDGVQKVK